MHIPAVGKFGDVHPAAHTAARAPHIGMAKRIPKRAMAAHTQAGDGSAHTMGTGAIMRIHPLHEFAADIGFVTQFRVHWRIEIPTRFAIGANDDDAIPIGCCFQIGSLSPLGVVVAKTVEQIHHGIMRGVGSRQIGSRNGNGVAHLAHSDGFHLHHFLLRGGLPLGCRRRLCGVGTVLRFALDCFIDGLGATCAQQKGERNHDSIR